MASVRRRWRSRASPPPSPRVARSCSSVLALRGRRRSAMPANWRSCAPHQAGREPEARREPCGKVGLLDGLKVDEEGNLFATGPGGRGPPGLAGPGLNPTLFDTAKRGEVA